MASNVKIVSIFGATGNQGGSVARSLAKNPAFHVRALARNPDSDKAKELASLGIEVVKANGWKRKEMEDAVRGSWAVWLNCNSDDPLFWMPGGPTEYEFTLSIVDSIVQAGVPNLFYSSATSGTALAKGQVEVLAMDIKNNIENYALSGNKFKTVCLITPGWYLENFLSPEMAEAFGGFPAKADGEGYLTFSAPKWGGKEDVPWMAMRRDFGDIVHGAFLNPEEYHGKRIHGLSAIADYDELVAAFQSVTGKKSRSKPLPSWTALEGYGIPALEIAKVMFAATQISGGRYMGPEPTEGATAKKLKKLGAKAAGKQGKDLELFTLKEFFADAFGPK